MTEVAFHFNAPDKWAYACRVARKALRHEMRVTIAGALEDLQRLDRMLWAMAPTDFVAHCLDDADEAVCAASPVLLVPQPGAEPARDLLLNLGAQVPQGFARYGRLVEVVGQADGEAERAQARTRWRQYEALGHAIVRHDLLRQGQE